MHSLHSLSIKANRDEVLTALRLNRTKHKQIVDEARAGYSRKAAELLQRKLDEVMKSGGNFVEPLNFSIPLPVDQTKSYDVVIKMLELSTEELIELDAAQVRHFVLDDWDWKGNFIESNKLYSATAASY